MTAAVAEAMSRGMAPLLDEHHLVLLSDDPRERRAVARRLAGQLSGLEGTRIIQVDGAAWETLSGDAEADAESVQAVLGGMISRFRGTDEDLRRRYLIWHDADELLERNVVLFGQVVNALLAIAVEHEFLTVDPLVLHRVVFTGGAKLGAYAEDEAGQFCRWLRGPAGQSEPLFEGVPECLHRPPVLTYRLDG